ncbi:MAG: hypothetical protein J6S80_02685 [Alphaproteobacteria bacterium]|nr:hypothetical protein [Alphaproteobacteria bacterium]
MNTQLEKNLKSALDKAREIVEEHDRQEEIDKWVNRRKGSCTKEHFLKIVSLGYVPEYKDYELLCSVYKDGNDHSKFLAVMDTKLLRVFCENGISPIDATKILKRFQTDYLFCDVMSLSDKLEWLDILVNVGHADIRVIDIKRLKEWADEKEKIEDVPIWEHHYHYYGSPRDYDDDPEIVGYEQRLFVPVKGAMDIFKKILELGYEPTKYEEVKTFLALAENLAGSRVRELMEKKDLSDNHVYDVVGRSDSGRGSR